MAKIIISQLHTADAPSIPELTNVELDATRGGFVTVDPDVRQAFVSALNNATFGTHLIVNNVLKSIGFRAVK